MERKEYLETIQREVDELADVIDGNFRAPVDSCPGWTTADLAWHVGEVLHVWCWIAATAARDLDGYQGPERPDDADLAGWLRDRGTEIVEVLSAASGDTPVWSWATDDATVAWIVRRMAHETAVHRWDGSACLSPTPRPIDPELATDGIDEFLQYFTGDVIDGYPGLGGTAHLPCTDVEGEWLVSEPDPRGPLRVSREHAKGDVAVRGPASDVLLALWRRVPLDDHFDVFGDRSIAERLVKRPDLR